MPFGNFSHNVIYNYPSASGFIKHDAPSTAAGNIMIDVINSFELIPTEFIRDFYGGETGLEYLENDDYALGPHYRSGLYESDLWKENYPELYEYYEYMRSGKKDLYPIMSDISDNIVVYLTRRPSLNSGELPPMMDADPKYGRFGNNHYFTSDPGFADYRNYDFQLTKEAADNLGVEWIDMSKIGVAGLPKPARVSDAYEDKDRWTPVAHDPLLVIEGAQPFAVVSFWRHISPGIWEWAADDMVNSEFACGLDAIPGAVYTAWYPGCENYPAQFLGGRDGEYPPDDVLTFTVDPDRSRWDVYEFKLVKPAPSPPPTPTPTPTPTPPIDNGGQDGNGGTNGSGGTNGAKASVFADDQINFDIASWSNPFTDVKINDWLYDDVAFVFINGLFKGASETTFEPHAVMTRAMLVTVLHRIDKPGQALNYENPFTDVPEGAYYAEAVKWAAANGIVEGVTGGRLFEPDAAVTREQLAVILTRYMSYKGVDLPVTSEFIIFADYDAISAYAVDAIQTLNKLGIINGVGANADGLTIIDPQGSAARAQVAAMLHRLLKAINEIGNQVTVRK
jgi:hypothetical protein